MTLASQMASDAASILLNTEEHAEDLSHVPARGLSGSVSFTGVFDLLESPVTEPKRGKEVIHYAKIQIGSAVDLKPEDSVTARGVVWQVTSVTLPQLGLREVRCEYREIQHRKPRGAM